MSNTSKKSQINLSPLFLDYMSRQIPNNNSNLMKRNYHKIKKYMIKSFLVGKHGFKMGIYLGSFLGFGIGFYQAVQMKKIWPIPVSMLGSGLVFGSMFAFSSILKAESEDKYKHLIINNDINK